MKSLVVAAGLLLVGFATDAEAQVSLIQDAEGLSVPELMEKCKSVDGAEAQLQCFDLLAQLLKEQQENGAQQTAAEAAAGKQPVIAEALKSLKAVAEYEDAESGLAIIGNGCRIQVLYYGNYYRISRRNVSSIDLFSARFDVSEMDYEKTTKTTGPTVTTFRGTMLNGAKAVSRGGAALESAAYGFASKPASATLSDYASEVASQLPATEADSFDFVLLHPKRADAIADIWGAFTNYAVACQSY